MKFPKSCASIGDCLMYLDGALDRDQWNEAQIRVLLDAIRSHTGERIDLTLCGVGFIWDDDNVLLLKRAPYVSHPHHYDSSGGSFEHDDADLGGTALREAHEETGLRCAITTPLGTTYAVNPAKKKFYAISAFSMEIAPQTSKNVILSSEHTDFGFYEPCEALSRHDAGAMRILYTTRAWLRRFHEGVVIPR